MKNSFSILPSGYNFAVAAKMLSFERAFAVSKARGFVYERELHAIQIKRSRAHTSAKNLSVIHLS